MRHANDSYVDRFLVGLVCVAVASFAMDSVALAQGGYAQSELNRLKNSSRASFYTVEREQSRNLTASVTRAGVGGVNRQTFLGDMGGGGGASRKKPFSGVSAGPSVSPYLSMSNRFGSASDYQTMIRPAREAERERQAQQMRDLRNQKRLNQMAAAPPVPITGNEETTPTGHTALRQNTLGSFQNTGGYFPPPSPPKRGR